MSKITYDNKVATKPQGVRINQFWDADANEIKTVVNEHDDRIEDLENEDSLNALGTKIEVNPRGGNYLNEDTLTSGWLGSDGSINASSDFSITDYLPISDGELLVCNLSAGDNPYIILYDDDFNYTSGVVSSVKQIVGTSSSKWCRFTIQNSKLGTVGIYLNSVPDTLGEYNPAYGYISDFNNSGGNILWLGTSIPEGCTYPSNSCSALGYTVTNKSKGSSFLIFDPTTPTAPISSSDGLSLSATVAELEAKYRSLVTSGDVTEAQLDIWKANSYENLMLPYLDNVDAIVIDHGFNDRYDLPNVVASGESSVDWTSRDRTAFIGAFGFIIDEILRRKPFMKILVGGYFQNTVDVSERNGSSICTVLEWIAENYNMPLLDTWNYAAMGGNYIPDTSTYIADFNAEYGTSYTSWNPDGSGNILAFQLFSPDTVHPYTDLSGNSNARLDKIFTKLLRDSI